MANKNYYDILGVAKDASEEEIRSAYRKKAKQYHPDVSKEPDAEAKFKEVQEAYETLNDPDNRAFYDRTGQNKSQYQNGFGGAGGFGGFEDMFSGGGGFGGFEDLFGSFFGGGQRRDPNAPQKGRDYQRVVNLTFEEAVLGTTKNFTITVDEACSVCEGTGAKTKADIETCKTCHGSGRVTVTQRTILGEMRSQETCRTCGGTGKTIKNKCENCNGSGRVKTTKNIELKVPAGVDNNTNQRMTGYGEGGVNGGPNGDLYLIYRVKPHKVFKRKGADILLTIPITITQATLGDSIDVPTIYGDKVLKIPAGTQPGTILRMRNMGTEKINGYGKGDQLVTVNVEIPKNLTKEQTEALKQFSKLDNKPSAWDKFRNFFKAD